MEDKRKETLQTIFGALYDLNKKGYYTTSFDYAGHIEGIGITIYKGAYTKNKKPIYQVLISTKRPVWKDLLSYDDFEPSDFLQYIRELSEYRPKIKTNRTK